MASIGYRSIELLYTGVLLGNFCILAVSDVFHLHYRRKFLANSSWLETISMTKLLVFSNFRLYFGVLYTSSGLAIVLSIISFCMKYTSPTRRYIMAVADNLSFVKRLSHLQVVWDTSLFLGGILFFGALSPLLYRLSLPSDELQSFSQDPEGRSRMRRYKPQHMSLALQALVCLLEMTCVLLLLALRISGNITQRNAALVYCLLFIPRHC